MEMMSLPFRLSNDNILYIKYIDLPVIMIFSIIVMFLPAHCKLVGF